MMISIHLDKAASVSDIALMMFDKPDPIARPRRAPTELAHHVREMLHGIDFA